MDYLSSVQKGCINVLFRNGNLLTLDNSSFHGLKQGLKWVSQQDEFILMSKEWSTLTTLLLASISIESTDIDAKVNACWCIIKLWIQQIVFIAIQSAVCIFLLRKYVQNALSICLHSWSK